MAVHKIIADFYENSFTLLALHSSLEDYALVYAVNACLNSKFKRSPKDLDLSDDISFPTFEWRDDKDDSCWTLFANKSIQEERLINNDLFANEPSYTKHYLVPEYKEADYLLKIEHETYNLEEKTIRKLKKIPKVITTYILDVETLKSKNNLIF